MKTDEQQRSSPEPSGWYTASDSYDRMSRKLFCAYVVKQFAAEGFGLKIIARFYAELLVLALMVGVCYIAPSLAFICFGVVAVWGFIVLMEKYTELRSWLRSLPIVRRLHDFGWSAKASFLIPFALFLLALFWVESYQSSEKAVLYERYHVSEVEKRQYKWFGDRKAEWAAAEAELALQVSACRQWAAAGLGAWYALLIMICLLRKGQSAPNRYGLPPKS